MVFPKLSCMGLRNGFFRAYNKFLESCFRFSKELRSYQVAHKQIRIIYIYMDQETREWTRNNPMERTSMTLLWTQWFWPIFMVNVRVNVAVWRLRNYRVSPNMLTKQGKENACNWNGNLYFLTGVGGLRLARATNHEHWGFIFLVPSDSNQPYKKKQTFKFIVPKH